MLVKTTLNYPVDMMEALRNIAHEQRVTVSDVIRDAIDAQLKVKPEEIVWVGEYGNLTNYQIGRAGEKYFFAWNDYVNNNFWPVNVELAENGISWHKSLRDAVDTARECFEANLGMDQDSAGWQSLINGLSSIGGGRRAIIKYDGEVVGKVVTNKNLLLDECLEFIGIDPNEMVGGDPKWDYQLFEVEYE